MPGLFNLFLRAQFSPAIHEYAVASAVETEAVRNIEVAQTVRATGLMFKSAPLLDGLDTMPVTFGGMIGKESAARSNINLPWSICPL